MTKTGPDKIDIYGLPPHQQPADIYDGPGHAGRGGWSWYTGAAARMISAAHALLGVKLEEGELKLRPDAFAEKAGLQLKSVTLKGRNTWPARRRRNCFGTERFVAAPGLQRVRAAKAFQAARESM